MGFCICAEKGDIVLLSDGRYGIIEKTETVSLSAPEITYNLEVEDFHTYFVGENPVCVHNAGCGDNQSWSKKRKNYWKKQAGQSSGKLGTRSASNTYDITSKNLQRMAQGKAPIGTDGYSVHLHHRVGKAVDINDFYEITRTDHYSNFKALHPWLFSGK